VAEWKAGKLEAGIGKLKLESQESRPIIDIALHIC